MSDVTKLPLWAQDRIAALERDVAYSRARSDAIIQGTTRVSVSDGITQLGHLDDHVTVRFTVSKDRYFDVSLRPHYPVNGKRGQRELMLDVSGSDPITITPHATNLVTINVEDRYRE